MNKKSRHTARRSIRTIAGRLVRELLRNFPENHHHREELNQKKMKKDKIYSLDEKEVLCISKSKKHKKYEFCNMASIIINPQGVIIGAQSFRCEYDANTIEKSFEQTQRLINQRPKTLVGDSGYRGKSKCDDTQIMIPKVPLSAIAATSVKRKQR